MRAHSICGVILVSDDVERLAGFYRDTLGLPIEREEHCGLPPHFGADIGETHLGIHPPQSFGRSEARSGGTVLALKVERLHEVLAELAEKGVRPVIEPHDEGFGPVAAIEDSDGNMVELVELRYEFSRQEGEGGA